MALNEDRVVNSVRNSFFGFLRTVLQLLFKFAVRTIFIKVLGQQLLGLDGLFTSILQVLSLAELGFSSVIVYSMYKPIAEKNWFKVGALLRIYKKIYFIVGTIILCVGSVLTPFIGHFISGELPSGVNIYVAYVIFLLNTVAGYLFSYKRSLLYATQRNDIENKISSIIIICLNLTQIILLLIVKNYYVHITVMLLFTITENIIISVVVNKMFGKIENKEKLSQEETKKLKKNMFAIIGHKVGGVAVFSTDNILMSAFLGLSTVAMYNNYYLLISAIAAFINVFFRAASASVGNSVAVEQVEKNYTNFRNLSFLNFWLIGFCSISFFILFQPFTVLWLGEQYLLSFGIVAAIVISFIFNQSRNVLLIYKDTTGTFYNDRYKPFIEAGVNLVVSLVLVQYIGLLGIIIGTIVSNVFVAIPVEAYVTHKHYFKKSTLIYLLKCILYIFIIVLVGAVTWLIDYACIPQLNTVPIFILKCVLCLILPNALFTLLSFKTSQFKYFKNLIVRLCKTVKSKLFKKKEKTNYMEIEKTSLDGVLILTPKVFGDNRGWFYETYSKSVLEKEGIHYDFVQDNQSFSAEKGTLRGLHFQNAPYAQTKLVRCTRGKIIDVAVDIRKGSPTFRQYVKVELSEENKKQFLIPKGFAHGFLTLTDNVEVQYKVDNIYAPQCDRSIRYDDPNIGVNWEIKNPVLSDKDKNAPLLKDSDCNFSQKVLVTGVKGQLGYDVVKKLQRENIEVCGVDIDDFDITDYEKTREYIVNYKPDVIVHCSAYTAVDKAEDDVELCYKVNRDGAENIAKVSREINAKIVYVSTDYVYDGQGEKPFQVEDNIAPLSVYGKSKYEGEKAVAENNGKHFIVRVSWVFGKNGNNFIKTMLRLAKEKDKLQVVCDQLGSPTYTVDLADLIFDMIQTEKYGTYNASNDGFVSWYDLAREIFRQANIDIQVDKVLTKDYVTKADRPLNSRMDKTKLVENGFSRLPRWEDALARFLQEIES